MPTKTPASPHLSPTSHHAQTPSTVLIIGGGCAGLTLALRLAQQGMTHITLLSKGHPLTHSASAYAQGGIAAALSPHDSPEQHAQDTLTVGAHLNDKAAVMTLTAQAPPMIDWLTAQGVHFNRMPASSLPSPFALGQEGGHHCRRIVHVDDRTGHALTHCLLTRVQAQPAIHCLFHCIALRLLRDEQGSCIGITVWDTQTHHIRTLFAQHTVLATGGASQMYARTTTPASATGDGIAMAWAAGAQVTHMEFQQFHPTCLYQPNAPRAFLLSEALRGEGATLHLTPGGTRFLRHIDPRCELAPRDIVATAIWQAMSTHRLPCVYLDITHHSATFLQKRFPHIYAHCQQHGLDPARTPLPVTPAAHYTGGGVVTDLSGKTTLAGLYAIGEVAHTGLHGANRMASNSLLECLAMGHRLANTLLKTHTSPATLTTRINRYMAHHTQPHPTHASPSQQHIARLSSEIQALRTLMWEHVGIQRHPQGLHTAQNSIIKKRALAQYYFTHLSTLPPQAVPIAITFYHLCIAATLTLQAACERTDSLGCHHRVKTL